MQRDGVGFFLVDDGIRRMTIGSYITIQSPRTNSTKGHARAATVCTSYISYNNNIRVSSMTIVVVVGACGVDMTTNRTGGWKKKRICLGRRHV